MEGKKANNANIRSQAGGNTTTSDDEDWGEAPVEGFIRHLLDTHRQWLEQDLPRIDDLMSRVENVDRFVPLRRAFNRVRRELEAHLRREENVLFPAILLMDHNVATGDAPPRLRFGSVKHPIMMLEQEHENDGQLWDELRGLTGVYAHAQNATQTIRWLYFELQALEEAIQHHSDLENRILFPRALELEQRRSMPS
jgi:regulator of cell morphogenesis and NO signaling